MVSIPCVDLKWRRAAPLPDSLTSSRFTKFNWFALKVLWLQNGNPALTEFQENNLYLHQATVQILDSNQSPDLKLLFLPDGGEGAAEEPGSWPVRMSGRRPRRLLLTSASSLTVEQAPPPAPPYLHPQPLDLLGCPPAQQAPPPAPPSPHPRVAARFSASPCSFMEPASSDLLVPFAFLLTWPSSGG